MEVRNILDISTRNELREWYEANHSTCKEFWIRVNRGKKDVTGVIPYVDSVEVVLCFGWIDSTLKHIDNVSNEIMKRILFDVDGVIGHFSVRSQPTIELCHIVLL